MYNDIERISWEIRSMVFWGSYFIIGRIGILFFTSSR